MKAVQRELADREFSRRHLIPFAKRVQPGFIDARHMYFLGDIFERAERRDPGYTRLVIHMPPQHGKSNLMSILGPAWWMGRNPNDKIIMVSYSDDLALDFGGAVRDIVGSEEYQTLFPHMALRQDSKSRHKWNAAQPYVGAMLSSGYTGSITGRGAKLMLIDDPIKNREEAESSTYREKLVRTYKSTLSTRLHWNSVVIITMTRWQPNDLAGWALNESGENYKYICLPALAEHDDPLGRKPYEPLWPQRFPQPMLNQKKKMMGSYDWNALYQGHPRPMEGSLFKRNYFKIVDRAPAGLFWVRYWDLAVSKTQTADYTASIRAAMDSEGEVYLDNRIRDKLEWPSVRKLIKLTAQAEDGTLVGIESVGTQKGMVQESWRDPDLAGVGIIGVNVHSDKRIRALPLSVRGEIGKLNLVRGEWNQGFIDELVDFPGANDDQVDAASGALHMLSGFGGMNEIDQM